MSEKQQKECWICYGADGSFISPCKCIGSTKYVHETCVLSWIDVRQKGLMTQSVKCPQCQTPYKIEYNSMHLIPLMMMERAKKAYTRLLFYGTIGSLGFSAYFLSLAHGFAVYTCFNGFKQTATLITRFYDSFDGDLALLMSKMLIGLPLIPITLIFPNAITKLFFPSYPVLLFYGERISGSFWRSPRFALLCLPVVYSLYATFARSLKSGLSELPEEDTFSSEEEEEEEFDDSIEEIPESPMSIRRASDTITSAMTPYSIIESLTLPFLGSIVGHFTLRRLGFSSFFSSLFGSMSCVLLHDTSIYIYTLTKLLIAKKRRVLDAK